MRAVTTCVALGLALLTGCTGTPPAPPPEAVGLALPERARTEAACGEERVPQEVIMHLQLIEDMNRQSKYHAALAHLDALGARGAELPRARFLRAEASRQVGEREEARALFTRLTHSCLAGLGHHGLARLAVDGGDLTGALVEFEAAERERPTDPRIRNDHGYTLLLAGRAPEARRQFQTAFELGGGGQVAANLVLTLLVAGDEPAARRFGANLGLVAGELDSIKARAAELRARNPAALPLTKESGT